jgi:hypothetical protein
MDDEWVKVPAETVRIGRERPVRLTAGTHEPLASVSGDAMYTMPVSFWWRRDEPLAGAPQAQKPLTR